MPIFLEVFIIIMITGSTLGTCGAGELRCQSSGHCIPKVQVCDGKFNEFFMLIS